MSQKVFGSDGVVAYLYEVDFHPAFSDSGRLLYMTIIKESNIPYFNETSEWAKKSEFFSRGVMNVPIKDSVFGKEDNFSELLGVEPLTCYGFMFTPKDETAIPFSEFVYKAAQRPDVIAALEKYAKA